MQSPVYYKTIASPVGALRLTATDKGLSGVWFERAAKRTAVEEEQADTHPMLLRAEKQLAEYFAGTRKHFDLRLDMHGTVFQIKAWHELQKIPYGQTISYGEQARRVGDAKKARAVGMANGRNPLSIVVPCHRVIGASGGLTGFGGGLPVKEFLLRHESSQA
ncbi:MAG: methylated-DNA--[protein]-cysteine S-methyltransferase [Rickettsiales bacterium]|nr:methylated-DNA--[protein]-cysteine S-methyltransferase [Rickettsiales bacterium]